MKKRKFAHIFCAAEFMFISVLILKRYTEKIKKKKKIKSNFES